VRDWIGQRSGKTGGELERSGSSDKGILRCELIVHGLVGGAVGATLEKATIEKTRLFQYARLFSTTTK
jgi:hypothetical protein